MNLHCNPIPLSDPKITFNLSKLTSYDDTLLNSLAPHPPSWKREVLSRSFLGNKNPFWVSFYDEGRLH